MINPVRAEDLFFQAGTSDKEYLIQMFALPGGNFSVEANWGRRGNLNSHQTKSPDGGIDRASADALFDSLVDKQIKVKGYKRSGEPTTPTVIVPVAVVKAGLPVFTTPMLLTAVGSDQVAKLIDDNDWMMQPKLDGWRALAYKAGDHVAAISRTGKPIGLPNAVVQEARKMSRNFYVDCELIDGNLLVHDFLNDDGVNLLDRTAETRARHAWNVFGKKTIGLVGVPTAYDRQEKKAMRDEIFQRGGEGIVFKNKWAPYEAFRSKNALKHKFVATTTVVVGHNKKGEKRSIGMYLFDGTYLGNCTIPSNHMVPPSDAIVEIQYLCRSGEDGCLREPVYLGPRKDVTAEDCTADQLQVKGELRG